MSTYKQFKRTLDSFIKLMDSSTKNFNNKKYDKIFKLFDIDNQFFILSGKDEYIRISRDNFEEVYSFYQKNKGKVKDVELSNLSKTAEFFIDIFNDLNFNIYIAQKKASSEPSTKASSEPSIIKTAKASSSIIETTKASSSIIETAPVQKKTAKTISDQKKTSSESSIIETTKASSSIIETAPVQKKTAKTISDQKKTSSESSIIETTKASSSIIETIPVQKKATKDTSVQKKVTSPKKISKIEENLLLDDNEDYSSLFSSLDINIPDRYVVYIDGIAHIINDEITKNSDDFDKLAYKLCPFHSHNFNFKNILSDENRDCIYGYILSSGNVYDRCQDILTKNIHISDEIISELNKESIALNGSFSTIQSDIKNLLDLIDEQTKMEMQIKTTKDGILNDEMKIYDEVKSDKLLNEIMVVFSNFVTIDISLNLIVNMIKDIKYKEYNYKGTAALEDLTTFFLSYDNFFIELKTSITNNFSNKLFASIYTINNELVNFNNYETLLPMIKESFIEKQNDIREIEDDIHFIEGNLKNSNIFLFTEELGNSKFFNKSLQDIFTFYGMDLNDSLKSLYLSLNVMIPNMIKDYISSNFGSNFSIISQLTKEIIESEKRKDEYFEMLDLSIDSKQYKKIINTFNNIELNDIEIDFIDDNFQAMLSKLKEDSISLINYVKSKYSSYYILKNEIERSLLKYDIPTSNIRELFFSENPKYDDIIEILYDFYDKIKNGAPIEGIIFSNDEKIKFFDKYDIGSNNFNLWKDFVISEISKSSVFITNQLKIISIYLSSNSSGIFLKNRITELNDQRKNNFEKFMNMKKKLNEINKNKILFSTYQNKKYELDKDIKTKIDVTIKNFNNRIPSAEVLINFFKDIKVPFKTNNLNIVTILDNLTIKKDFIIKKLNEIPLDDIKITLALFKRTLIFKSLRDKIYKLYKRTFSDLDFNFFNKMMKEVSSLLRNVDINYFYFNSNLEYSIINSEIIRLLPTIVIDKKNTIEYANNLIKNLPEKHKIEATKIINTNYYISICIDEIKDKILSSIKIEILSASIPNLNSGNPFFNSFFTDEKFLSQNISNITESNIKNYHQIMISLLKTIEHSSSLINKGPGMHFLYNCLIYYLQILSDVYQQISNDNYNFSITINKEFIDTYKKFLSLSTNNFLHSKDFNNFCSLLTGKLSSNIFTKETSDIKDFNSPYHTSDILTDTFVITSFNILDLLVKKQEIVFVDVISIINEYGLLFEDSEFFIEDLNDIRDQLEYSDNERIEYLLTVQKNILIKFFKPVLSIATGVKDLMTNVNMFTSEYLTKNNTIVSYNKYEIYKDNYIFYEDKKYLREMMIYFYLLFKNLIIEDDKSYTKDIIDNILLYFELFNEGMNRISKIEKNNKNI